jgi:hypothetical protein
MWKVVAQNYPTEENKKSESRALAKCLGLTLSTMFLTLSSQVLNLLSLAIVSSASAQAILGANLKQPVTKPYAQSYTAPYDDGLFTPVEQLSTLAVNSFTTLSHPVFPNYSVRIKKSEDFCDGTVKLVFGSSCPLYLDLTRVPVPTQDTLTLRLDTYSSTSSRVAMTPPRTT